VARAADDMPPWGLRSAPGRLLLLLVVLDLLDLQIGLAQHQRRSKRIAIARTSSSPGSATLHLLDRRTRPRS